jgi:hypothetical protein
MEDALCLLELYGSLCEDRRQQVLWFAETLADRQQRYGMEGETG